MEPERSGIAPEELVPLAEGSRRLGLAHDTARKQLAAGTLRGEKRQGRWWVWAPMPDASGVDPARSGTMPDAVVARLESEIAYLRDQVAAERDARTDAERRHAAEIERRDFLFRDALARIPLGLPAETSQYAPQDDADFGPLRGDSLQTDSAPFRPSADRLALGWRRWWRRMMGG